MSATPTSALTTLATHYDYHPHLPNWAALRHTNLDGLEVQLHDTDVDGLIAWADTLTATRVTARVLASSHPTGTSVHVRIAGLIAGQPVRVWNQVNDLGLFLGLNLTRPKLGEARTVDIGLGALVAFADQQHANTRAVAA